MAGQGIYDVDMVLCIDGTGSMTPIIEEVKRNALALYPRFEEAMSLAGKDVGSTRVKVIVFGDYKDDPVPMRESEFFTLPEQEEAFKAFVEGIVPNGGGDLPENAFEAIAFALKSDWRPIQNGRKARQVIAVFSDAPALPLGERSGCPGYPTDIPQTMPELSAFWEGSVQTTGNYSQSAGRLITFVPNDESWTQLEAWNRATPSYTAAGGCDDIDMQTIIDTVVGSFDK